MLIAAIIIFIDITFFDIMPPAFAFHFTPHFDADTAAIFNSQPPFITLLMPPFSLMIIHCAFAFTLISIDISLIHYFITPLHITPSHYFIFAIAIATLFHFRRHFSCCQTLLILEPATLLIIDIDYYADIITLI